LSRLRVTRAVLRVTGLIAVVGFPGASARLLATSHRARLAMPWLPGASNNILHRRRGASLPGHSPNRKVLAAAGLHREAIEWNQALCQKKSRTPAQSNSRAIVHGRYGDIPVAVQAVRALTIWSDELDVGVSP
jgi:hypothetical protein